MKGWHENFKKQGHKKPGQMNRTEQKHAWTLQARQQLGEIKSYSFETIKLLIGITPEGRKMFYEPDFMVTLPDGSIEIHEVKGGFITDDGYVKLTAAAKQFPQFKFVLFQLKKRLWTRKEICN